VTCDTRRVQALDSNYIFMAVLPPGPSTTIDPQLQALIQDTLPNCVFVHSSLSLLRIFDEVLLHAAAEENGESGSRDVVQLPLLPSASASSSSLSSSLQPTTLDAASPRGPPSRRRS